MAKKKNGPPKVTIAGKRAGKNAIPVANALAEIDGTGGNAGGGTPPAVPQRIDNGLASALGFGPGAAMNPFNHTEQLSSPTTLFHNMRWYLVSNFRQMLSEAYVEIGLIQTIVNVPVDDALRGGIEIKTKQLNEEEIADLQASLDRDDDLNKVGQAAKWNRLFGGAGVLILTDQDPEEPLDLDAIDENTPLEFRACDMWELFFDEQSIDGEIDISIQTGGGNKYFNYYGERIHRSRVMAMKGITAPSFVRSRLRGWGFSVVETLVRSINQYLKATNLGFEVLDEFKLDVYKIKNLVNTLMDPQGEESVRKRIALGNMQKNYNNALVMDSDDDYDHKQLSFAGLSDVMAGIRMQVASEMRIPITKLFGISAAGFNSGEDDIEVYNAMVESEVRSKAKYEIVRILELRCQQRFGFIPDDLSITFKPLRVMSSEQEETVKTQKFTRLQSARQLGEITSQEFREACNRANLLEIQLDPNVLAPNGDDDDSAEVDEENPDAEADGDAPQAKDSRKTPSPKKAGASKSPTNPEVKNYMRNTSKLIVLPEPWTSRERMLRAIFNSMEFDMAAYAAEGGDNWIDPRRKELFMKPGNVDEELWQRAKSASRAAFGKEKWQFITWWYKKQGGRFV